MENNSEHLLSKNTSKQFHAPSILRKTIQLDTGVADGYLIDLGNAPLILIKTKCGYVMCGYLNIAASNKLGDIAGRVTGVKTFDDVLNAKIVEVSENAKKNGLTEGMMARDFLNKIA
jgi:uncharacterized protein YunC (DUF1805 family)